MTEKTYVEINQELADLLDDFKAEQRQVEKLREQPGVEHIRNSAEHIMRSTAVEIAGKIRKILDDAPF